jgi:hypothetical protein
MFGFAAGKGESRTLRCIFYYQKRGKTTLALLCGRLNFHDSINLQPHENSQPDGHITQYLNNSTQRKLKNAWNAIRLRQSDVKMQSAMNVPTAARAWRPFSPNTLTCASVNCEPTT